MTDLELAALLDTKTTQVQKIAKEQATRFDALSAEILRLNELIVAGREVTQETVDAFNRVQAALNELDAAIPDAPEPPEQPPV